MPEKKYDLIVLLIMGLILLPVHAKADSLKSINNYLPGPLNEKLDIDFELRYRLEYRDNFDFNDKNDDEDGFHLLRTRVNLDFDAAEYLGAFVQLQDSRIWESQFPNKSPYENNFKNVRCRFSGFSRCCSIGIKSNQKDFKQAYCIRNRSFSGSSF
ncbi:MAG TPA: hypothetical protein ENH82_12120 [bacterium]|nr:hypothetical protein [bacterium]